MRDLGVLKERIEYAERHLKAAHTARERESDALMSMWAQIRDRFDAQEVEIADFRQQVADLTRVNDELSQMVDRLISSVEGSVDEAANETVPEVAGLAGDLLKSEPVLGTQKPAPAAAAPTAPAAPAPEPVEDLDELETDDPLGLGAPIDSPMETDTDTGASFDEILTASLIDDDDTDFEADLDIPEAVTEESASNGIRDLISRIENSVKATAEEDAPAATEDDDELSRELREIESLRDELAGLHDKIAK